MRVSVSVLATTAILSTRGVLSGEVITPVSVEAGLTYDPPALINASNLDSSDRDILNWTHNPTSHDAGCWKGSANPIADLPPITFDLGQPYVLLCLYTWNYSHTNPAYGGRQMRSFVVNISTNGDTWTTLTTVHLPGDNEGVLLQRTNVTRIDARTRYVRFSDFHAYSEDVHGAEAGLGEVRFEGWPASGILLVIL